MRLRILWLAFLAPCIALAAGHQWSKQYSVSSAPELVVRADDGDVKIRKGGSNVVEALVVVEGWEIGPGGVRIDERQTGNRIDLEVRIPKFKWDDFDRRRSVRIELRVPDTVRADIKTGDGAIVAAGLSGDIRLRTGDGKIDGEGFDGTLDAETGDGGIRVRGRFDGLRTKTGDGSIEAEAGPGSKMVGPWEIRTGDGSVTLRLPEGFAASLDANSGDGKVTVDMPLTVMGQLREGGARGKLNGGGPPLTIRTGDGSIRIGSL